MAINIKVFRTFKIGSFQLAKGARTIELDDIELIADAVANGDISFALPSRKIENIVRDLNLLVFNLLVENKVRKTAADNLTTVYNSVQNQADSMQSQINDQQSYISDLQSQYQSLRDDFDKFGGK